MSARRLCPPTSKPARPVRPRCRHRHHRRHLAGPRAPPLSPSLPCNLQHQRPCSLAVGLGRFPQWLPPSSSPQCSGLLAWPRPLAVHLQVRLFLRVQRLGPRAGRLFFPFFVLGVFIFVVVEAFTESCQLDPEEGRARCCHLLLHLLVLEGWRARPGRASGWHHYSGLTRRACGQRMNEFILSLLMTALSS